MPSDADRFRPRDPRAIAEQSPPARERPLYVTPQDGSPQYAPPQYAPPQYAAPQVASSPTEPPAHAVHAHPALDTRDAPLIHPGAAQASSVVAYGVPVYRAPAYALLPQPARGLSITALVLGICSVVFAWTLVVVPILGIVFGFIALRREPAGRTMAIVGLIASGVGLLFVLLFYLLPFGLFFAALLLGGW